MLILVSGLELSYESRVNYPPLSSRPPSMLHKGLRHTESESLGMLPCIWLPRIFLRADYISAQFNVELDDTDVIREELRAWRTCDATENRPPPLVIETYLDTNGLTNNQSLVILDENGKRWDVLDSLAAFRGAHSMRPRPRSDDVILERWKIELGEPSGKPPADLGSILPTVYKKSIVLFRSLFTYAKFLPAWKFAKRNLKLRVNPALRIKYRILDGRGTLGGPDQDHLTVPLYDGSSKIVDTYNFGVTESPAGPFSVQVTYRTNCDFRVDDSEALLSSRFMGADDEIFRPSLPSGNLDKAQRTETGSVPVDKMTTEYPDCTRAYGSLSSFHQIGPTTGPSPISALRAAGEAETASQTPSDPPSRRISAPGKVSPVGRAAVLAGEGVAVARRPSVSFQPFKAPALSASPSLVDPPLGASPRQGSFRPPTSDSRYMPSPLQPTSSRKPSGAPENVISPSNSASPKPAPITRYSSAFGHRRGRHTGSANRNEDDNSSGKGSAASSAAQPGSGLLTEAAGTSAESVHADDENISEFLKMLDLRKDLLNTANSSALDATRRTTALTRFQRMRDSNAALSDSMSSSLLLQRSSNSSSKQLSAVPPMLGGTSVSTDSSPGKQMSPHTPHTPAIPSRLSSNSIVDYNRTEGRSHRSTHQGHDSPISEGASEGTAQRAPSTAIDIPTSPRISAPSAYRRSNSAANRRPIPPDDDEIFPFGMRSVSLGNEDRSHPSLSALLRQQEYENAAANTNQSKREPRSSAPPTSATAPCREIDSHRGASNSGPTGTSSSSNHRLYQPRFGHVRGRGSSGGPHSISSTSSSVARGAVMPPHPVERDHDHDGNGSGSNSGNSTMETRRGSGQRTSSGRMCTPQAMLFDEDEPLLFAMSDFGASRRSLEEGRQGHGADSSGNASGSRRGSGRRGAPFPSFHAWS